jgi:hypothetical protein
MAASTALAGKAYHGDFLVEKSGEAAGGFNADTGGDWGRGARGRASLEKRWFKGILVRRRASQIQ